MLKLYEILFKDKNQNLTCQEDEGCNEIVPRVGLQVQDLPNHVVHEI